MTIEKELILAQGLIDLTRDRHLSHPPGPWTLCTEGPCCRSRTILTDAGYTLDGDRNDECGPHCLDGE